MGVDGISIGEPSAGSLGVDTGSSSSEASSSGVSADSVAEVLASADSTTSFSVSGIS